MNTNHKPGQRFSLLGAIAAASIVSSLLVFALGLFGARPFLVDYVRDVVRGHQAAIEDFFTDSISQQILVGDGPDVLRKCHMLLRKDYVRAVSIKDISGEVICQLNKPNDGYAVRWTKSPIFFDEDKKEMATEVWLAFSTQDEERLIWAALIAAFAGAGLLLMFQFVFTIPLSRRILKPLADISSAVDVNNPEDIKLPELQQYRPLVAEVRAIFHSMQSFLQRFQHYKSQLIESTRYEAVARTVQIIAHDLKAPMASFERLTRIPEAQFAQERKYLIQALQQLYSMTDAIKRAEFEDIVRLKTDHLDLTLMQQHGRSIAEKLGKTLEFAGPMTVTDLALDQPKLIRALSNLMINALEAAHSQVSICIQIGQEELNLVVEDDGPGVPGELEARLFTRGATQGKEQGTGLGLHYAKRVAEGHGGHIHYKRLESRTRFIITIPCNRPQENESSLWSDTAVPVEAAKDQKDFLLVIQCEERIADLKKNISNANVDVFLPQERIEFESRSYRYILCEDWDLAANLRPLKQKILIDPADSLEKILLVLERLRKGA